MSRFAPLVALLILTSCRSSTPPPKPIYDASDPSTCSNEASIKTVSVLLGHDHLYPAYVAIKTPNTYFPLFTFARPPFNLGSEDLCRVQADGARALLDCDLPPVDALTPMDLAHRSATIRASTSDLKITFDKDGKPHDVGWKVPSGECWRLDVASSHEDGTVEQRVNRASQATCTNGEATRDVRAFLSFKVKHEVSKGEFLQVTLTSDALNIHRVIADLFGVRMCRSMVPPRADAALLRCDSSDDGITPVIARAYAVPGRLWATDNDTPSIEAAMTIPCDVRIHFEQSDLCAAAPHFCSHPDKSVLQ